MEPKILRRSEIILKDTNTKFKGRSINVLAELRIIFISRSTNRNNYYCWLFIKLIFVSIDSISY